MEDSSLVSVLSLSKSKKSISRPSPPDDIWKGKESPPEKLWFFKWEAERQTSLEGCALCLTFTTAAALWFHLQFLSFGVKKKGFKISLRSLWPGVINQSTGIFFHVPFLWIVSYSQNFTKGLNLPQGYSKFMLLQGHRYHSCTISWRSTSSVYTLFFRGGKRLDIEIH